MKKFLLLIFLAALPVAGCSTRYDITTSTGAVITTKGKPTYDKSQSSWSYIDMNGKPHTISAGSVTQVAPQSEDIADSEKKFKPVVKK